MTLPAQDIVERLRDYGLTLEESVVICDRRVVDEAADTISRLTADNEALRKTNEHWRRQSRDGFEAFSAMRDAINEVVPMQSAEADLLDGPELFVSCEAVALAVVSRVTALEAENKVLREDQNALDKLLQLMGIADSDCAPDEVLQGILEAFDRLSAWNADFLHHDQWEIIAGALGRWNKGERADDYTLGIIDFGFKRLVEAKLSFAAALGGSDHV